MNFPSKSIPLFLLLIGICSIATSCDQTQLTGNIEGSAELAVGETKTYTLKIPETLDGIYRIHWEVSPSDAGSIEYKECRGQECEQAAGYRQDRTARFTAHKPGKCTISTSGFYRQTNPQGITKLDINISTVPSN